MVILSICWFCENRHKKGLALLRGVTKITRTFTLVPRIRMILKKKRTPGKISVLRHGFLYLQS